MAEILDRTAQWFDSTRRMGAKGLAGTEVIAQLLKGFDVATLPLALFEGAQYFHAPRQTIAARGAKTTRFAGKKLFHIAQQADHVDAFVDGHGQARAHPRTDLGDASGVHGRI